jgi:hypothetical protein
MGISVSWGYLLGINDIFTGKNDGIMRIFTGFNGDIMGKNDGIMGTLVIFYHSGNQLWRSLRNSRRKCALTWGKSSKFHQYSHQHTQYVAMKYHH